MGSWARRPFSLLFGMNNNPQDTNGQESQSLPAWQALDVCSDLGLAYLNSSSEEADSKDLTDYLETKKRFLIYGTDYLN